MSQPGYQSIEESLPEGVKKYTDDAGQKAGDAGASKLQQVSQAAGEAFANAKNAVTSTLTEDIPINIYTDPLNPTADLSLKDRISLVLDSARPWGEFLDLRQFNLPPGSEIKLRVIHNVETYFYNYYLISLIYMCIFAFGHLGSVLATAAVLCLAFYLYVLNPEPISLFGKFEINTPIKHSIVAVLAILALFYGHVFSLVFSLAIFMLVVVGLHSLLRDHTS